MDPDLVGVTHIIFDEASSRGFGLQRATCNRPINQPMAYGILTYFKQMVHFPVRWQHTKDGTFTPKIRALKVCL